MMGRSFENMNKTRDKKVVSFFQYRKYNNVDNHSQLMVNTVITLLTLSLLNKKLHEIKTWGEKTICDHRSANHTLAKNDTRKLQPLWNNHSQLKCAPFLNNRSLCLSFLVNEFFWSLRALVPIFSMLQSLKLGTSLL